MHVMRAVPINFKPLQWERNSLISTSDKRTFCLYARTCLAPVVSHTAWRSPPISNAVVRHRPIQLQTISTLLLTPLMGVKASVGSGYKLQHQSSTATWRRVSCGRRLSDGGGDETGFSDNDLTDANCQLASLRDIKSVQPIHRHPPRRPNSCRHHCSLIRSCAVHWPGQSGWRCWGVRRRKRQWNGPGGRQRRRWATLSPPLPSRHAGCSLDTVWSYLEAAGCESYERPCSRPSYA